MQSARRLFKRQPAKLPGDAELNKAGEIRIYVRHIATRLVKMGVLRDTPDIKGLPDEYWKFRNVQPEPGKKKRSPEFLADTTAALRFADRYFQREAWDESKCPEGMDISAACASLRGPIFTTDRRACFTPGDWMPDGFEIGCIGPGPDPSNHHAQKEKKKRGQVDRRAASDPRDSCIRIHGAQGAPVERRRVFVVVDRGRVMVL